MGLFNGTYLLRTYESNSMGEGPGDKVMIFRQGTAVGGNITFDLSTLVRGGAVVEWFVCQRVTITSASSTGALDINGVAGDTDTVTVCFLINQHDLL